MKTTVSGFTYQILSASTQNDKQCAQISLFEVREERKICNDWVRMFSQEDREGKIRQ